jgi:deazaflavin-dependent oxidoreductase (nitroreductase family)
VSVRESAFVAGRPANSRPIRWAAKYLGPVGLVASGRSWFPFYAVLHHIGRRSGRAYATPIVALRTADGFLIPLPFGDATQWARNLFAAGVGELRYGGRMYQVSEPRVVDREAVRENLPRLVAFMTRRIGLRQFVSVRSPI